MRALILNGSARPIGSTGNIVGDIIEELEKGGVETLHVPLYEYHFTPCNACRTCEMRGDGMCADVTDGTNEILDVMRQADLIILAAPGYAGGAPGVMKLFLEKAAFVCPKATGDSMASTVRSSPWRSMTVLMPHTTNSSTGCCTARCS